MTGAGKRPPKFHDLTRADPIVVKKGFKYFYYTNCNKEPVSLQNYKITKFFMTKSNIKS